MPQMRNISYLPNREQPSQIAFCAAYSGKWFDTYERTLLKARAYLSSCFREDTSWRTKPNRLRATCHGDYLPLLTWVLDGLQHPLSWFTQAFSLRHSTRTACPSYLLYKICIERTSHGCREHRTNGPTHGCQSSITSPSCFLHSTPTGLWALVQFLLVVVRLRVAAACSAGATPSLTTSASVKSTLVATVLCVIPFLARLTATTSSAPSAASSCAMHV